MSFDLSSIRTNKRVCTVVGTGAVNVHIKTLGYKGGEEVYILNEDEIKALIKCNRDVDSKIVKALDRITNEISCGNRGQ